MYKCEGLAKGENKLRHWYCKIEEDKDKIWYTYDLYKNPYTLTAGYTLTISKENLKITFEECVEYLKNINFDKVNPMNVFSKFLDEKKIKYQVELCDQNYIDKLHKAIADKIVYSTVNKKYFDESMFIKSLRDDKINFHRWYQKDGVTDTNTHKI